MDYIQYVIIANGVYDIVSATGVITNSSLGMCHTSMFITRNRDRDRWLGYFVFAYGCMRLTMTCPFWTYVFEALCIYNEAYVHRAIVPWKGRFVVVSSIIMACLSAVG